MRTEFTKEVEKIAKKNNKIIFLTGDLGFNAFESLKSTMGNRFINIGVAEQSMVGIAAGLARKGFTVFCYSIAPFLVYRALEQIRNDITFHNLPVILVGNGGGFGYGIMGSSHHAISDLACISSLGNITSWIPCFSNDIKQIVNNAVKSDSPTYIRLGKSISKKRSSNISGSFSIVSQSKSEITVIALGALIEDVIQAVNDLKLNISFNLLSCISLPLVVKGEVLKVLKRTNRIIVLEDHVQVGGIAQQLSYFLNTQEIKVTKFISLTAKDYPSGTYGDQKFHHIESGIDLKGIKKAILNVLEK